MALKTRSAVLTLKGMRPTNEDAVLEADLPHGRHLVGVADGMGGHRSGEVASTMALDQLNQEVRAGRSLEDAVRLANAAVLAEADRNPECSGMGTTLVAFLRSGSAYQLANVGDSRAYRIDRGEIRQLTVDHSFAAEAARAGGLSSEEIARSPWRNALTRSLGTQAGVEIDLFGPFEISGPPHAVLMCSDGVYRALSNQTIWSTLLRASSPIAAVRSLAALAIQNGSDDNISLALVEFGPLLGTDPGPGRPTVAARSHVGEQNGAGPRPALHRAEHAVHPGGKPAQLARRPAPAAPRRRRRLQRWLARLLSSDTLFLFCAAAIMLWLILNLTDL